MTYKPGIPQADDDMSVSQPDLLANFTALNTQFGEDHVTFNATSDNGKHNKVTFVEQADPDNDIPNPNDGEIIMYAAEDNDGNTELYVKQHNKTANQFTKGGAPFVGMIPVAACNFQPGTSGGGNPIGVQSGYNIDNANCTDDGSGKYTITFTNSITDNNGNPDDDYLWTIQGFDNSNNPVIGSPLIGAYASAVTDTAIKVKFVNQNGGAVTGLVAGSVICWRLQ